MRVGYNTNGFAHHPLPLALQIMADEGYRSVALTLDYHCLDPFDPDWVANAAKVRRFLERLGLASVVETGARFLLDFRQKHEPTLVSPGEEQRARRVDFLRRAVDMAALLGSDCVSLWSGVPRDCAPESELWPRLCGALQQVLDHAEARGVVLGFEPEPGMFVDTMVRYGELRARMPSDNLRLTLDVGHVHCMREGPVADQVTQWGAELVNLHIEDMRAGVHEHLMFGEGEMDFPPIAAALRQVGYRGGVHVELSRHSHDAPSVARRARQFLHEAGFEG
ncbi:MAG: sugar phosphate isomerase/epimerase family protein [Pirellulaceae bacterium]